MQGAGADDRPDARFLHAAVPSSRKGDQVTTSPRNVVCPVCDSAVGLRFIYDNGLGDKVYACKSCNTVALDSGQTVQPLDDEHYVSDDMERLYQEQRFRFERTALDYARVLDEVRGAPQGTERPRLLDVGAGLGVFLDVARERGYEGEGLDIRRSAVEFIASRSFVGHHCRLEALAERRAAAYDVVTAWNVIEHDDNPRQFVSLAYSLLRPGGWFLLETPHGSHALKRAAFFFFRMTPPGRRPLLTNLHTASGHRWGFSPDGMRNLLGVCGFEQVSVSGVPYDHELASKKVLSRVSGRPGKLVGAAILKGVFGAMRVAGIQNRFVAWGRKPAT